MNDLELIQVETVDVNNLTMYQHEKALIDTQIATAKAFPRDLQKCIDNAITVITLDVDIAKDCVYSLVKGGTKIEGPGVNLAKIIASEMGNMRVENKVIGYDATHVTCEATCFDLERNYAMRTTVKKSIVGSRGRYSEDMCVITGNAANSVALRNAVFTVVGKPIIDKLYKTAKGVITGDISTPKKLAERKRKLFDGFLKQFKDKKLTEEEIIKYCGKETYEEVDADDIASLIGLGNALKATETNFEDSFRPVKSNEPATPVDNEQKENQRLLDAIEASQTRDKLKELQKDLITQEHRNAYDTKWKSLA